MPFFLIIPLLFSCTHLVQKEYAVEIIPVVGTEREIQTVQNKLKNDGCLFLRKIVGTPVDVYGSEEEKAMEGLRKRAREIGAHIVISNLRPQNKLKQTYGLAYKCPHLEEDKEDSQAK